MAPVPSAPHPSHRATRAVRAALFAVVCVGVGATLHGRAGGCPATWAAVGLGWPAVWLAAWFGLARERSWSALTVGLGAAQVGLHLLFNAFETGAATAHATAVAMANAAPVSTAPFSTAPFSTAPFSSAMPGMAAPSPGAFAASAMPDMPGMAMQHPNPFSAALTMITAHALAVVVCGWWLGQGERDFFALCRAAGALVAAPVRWLTGAIAALAATARSGAYVAPRSYRTAPERSVKRRATPVLTTLTFRGPPVVA
jgi:hypothetical protein